MLSSTEGPGLTDWCLPLCVFKLGIDLLGMKLLKVWLYSVTWAFAHSLIMHSKVAPYFFLILQIRFLFNSIKYPGLFNDLQ